MRYYKSRDAILYFLDRCADNSDISGLPGGILKEFLGIVINGTIENVFGCQENPQFTNEDIEYNLYNRKNANESIILTSQNYCDLDITKSTILVFPGWLCDIYNRITQDLVQGFLKRYDCNVLAVNYQKLSFDLYSNAVCNIEKGAYLIGKFLCELVENIGLDLSTIHLIGHSLGAQLSGNVGYNVQKICNKKVDRITGLDPAGPIYQTIAPSRRLDKTDATFVDIIHTNMGIAGYYGSLGHVDFFPNCGVIQPGCLQIGSNSSIMDVINLSMNVSKLGLIIVYKTIIYFKDAFCFSWV